MELCHDLFHRGFDIIGPLSTPGLAFIETDFAFLRIFQPAVQFLAAFLKPVVFLGQFRPAAVQFFFCFLRNLKGSVFGFDLDLAGLFSGFGNNMSAFRFCALRRFFYDGMI